jgi:hypothetical protein
MTPTDIIAIRQSAVYELANLNLSGVPEGSRERVQPEVIVQLCDMVLGQICPKCRLSPRQTHSVREAVPAFWQQHERRRADRRRNS